MTKFLIMYSGGEYPESEEESKAVMAEWGQWMESCGPALADGGDPLGDKAHLGKASDSSVNGYSIMQAKDMAEAKAACEGHPHLKHGGGIEIAECGQM